MSVDAHRRISNTYDPSDFIGSTRRVSLREMPSFRNDVSSALLHRNHGHIQTLAGSPSGLQGPRSPRRPAEAEGQVVVQPRDPAQRRPRVQALAQEDLGGGIRAHQGDQGRGRRRRRRLRRRQGGGQDGRDVLFAHRFAGAGETREGFFSDPWCLVGRGFLNFKSDVVCTLMSQMNVGDVIPRPRRASAARDQPLAQFLSTPGYCRIYVSPQKHIIGGGNDTLWNLDDDVGLSSLISPQLLKAKFGNLN